MHLLRGKQDAASFLRAGSAPVLRHQAAARTFSLAFRLEK